MIPFSSFSLVFVLIVVAGGPGFSGTRMNPGERPGRTVKIGLLIPDPGALAAKHGAELAIREANEGGGECTYQLVVRSTDGPWGAGSKESVSLVFTDEVAAIMGSLDGRNAHLAEQVATRTRIVFLSAWATDMTLSGAFVPWYYRCLPNDRQQAVSLVIEIYRKRKLKKVASISSKAYDSRHAAGTFADVARAEKVSAPLEFICGPSPTQIYSTLTEIQELGMEAIILFTGPEMTGKIMPVLRQQGMNQMIFGTLAIADDQRPVGPDWHMLEGATLVSPGHWFTPEGLAFQSAFHKTYGYQPGAAAAYAYDGMNVIIGVIRKAGADRDRIIEAFAEVHHRSGITGEVQFDEKGNRAGQATLMMIKKGKPYQIAVD